ncbi:MAG: dethiobiotin synthase [Polyangiaceae bacterium]
MKQTRILVLGTGTGIGKTFVSRCLVRARPEVAGLKPIESGVSAEGLRAGRGEDGASIGSARFLVPPAPYLFVEPVSPHLAAALEGRSIDVGILREWLSRVRVAESGEPPRALLVESAGGAFSPLSQDLFNADLATQLEVDRVVLVAPNRLGVLHDVAATLLALAVRVGRTPDCLILNECDAADLRDRSRPSNLRELGALLERLAPNCRLFPFRRNAEPTEPEPGAIWRLLLAECFT